MQRNLQAGDMDAVMTGFARVVLDITPAGARVIDNDGEFRGEIRERIGWLRQAGMRSIKALEIDPIPLGAGYAMVKVRWSVWFTPQGEPGFVDEFLVDFLVHPTAKGMEVVAFIAHDDDEAMQRRMGLSNNVELTRRRTGSAPTARAVSPRTTPARPWSSFAVPRPAEWLPVEYDIVSRAFADLDVHCDVQPYPRLGVYLDADVQAVESAWAAR